MMPLLDIQTNILDGKVNYIFYKKHMANPFQLRADSAMPLEMKRTALIQEALRRLLRTKRGLPWGLKAEILSEFSRNMMCSGYWERFRYEVIEAAVRRYECQKSDLGIEPLRRSGLPWSTLTSLVAVGLNATCASAELRGPRTPGPGPPTPAPAWSAGARA